MKCLILLLALGSLLLGQGHSCLQLSPGVNLNPSFYPCGTLDPFGIPNPVGAFVPPCTIGPMWCPTPHPTIGSYSIISNVDIQGNHTTFTMIVHLDVNSCQLLHGLFHPLNGPTFLFLYMRPTSVQAGPTTPSVFGPWPAELPVAEFEIPAFDNSLPPSPFWVSVDQNIYTATVSIKYQAHNAFAWMNSTEYEFQILWFVPNQLISDWVGFFTLPETYSFGP